MTKIDKLLQEAIEEAKEMRKIKDYSDRYFIEEELEDNDFDIDLDDDSDIDLDWEDTDSDVDLGGDENGELLFDDEDSGLDLNFETDDDFNSDLDDELTEDWNIEDVFEDNEEEIAWEDEMEQTSWNLEESVRKELAAAYDLIYQLKEELKKSNLNNARLLYSLQMISEQYGQEVDKILEMFTRAKSVKEAKLMYEAMKHSNKKRNLSEGYASKRVNSTRPQKSTIDPTIMRLQKLAGIIK